MDRKKEMLEALRGKFFLCPPNPQYEIELKEIRERHFNLLKQRQEEKEKENDKVRDPFTEPNI